MDDTLPRRFFEQPTCPQQRQYEALRAVFLAGLSQKEAAGRFHYSHCAFRLLVQQFRAACAAGTPPPFLPGHPGDGRRPLRPDRSRPGRRSQRSRTPGR
jgi:hypothetical protein